MKVSEPRFDEFGEVDCVNCPFSGLTTNSCISWLILHNYECPTAETYAAACALAEAAEKEGSK